MEETKRNMAYQQYIRGLAFEGKDVVFFNSSAAHAAIVMGTMFEFARNEIKIYCGSFWGKFPGDPNIKKGWKSF